MRSRAERMRRDLAGASAVEVRLWLAVAEQMLTNPRLSEVRRRAALEQIAVCRELLERRTQSGQAKCAHSTAAAAPKGTGWACGDD